MRLVEAHRAPEALVDYPEMARQLDISVRTLQRMVAANEVPHVRLARRTVRFQPSVVRAAVFGGPVKSEAA